MTHHPAAITAAGPARPVLASHPLLRWDAIAAHARDHHAAAWPDDTAAITAITGAFDAIAPGGCDYSPAAGTITAPPLPAPAARVPAWDDPERLNCALAALAAADHACDLDEIYGTIHLVVPRPA